jgi:Beta propeller domain
MNRAPVVLAATLFSSGCALVVGGAHGRHNADAGRRTLTPFHSVQELRHTLAPVVEARRVAEVKALAEWRKECRTWAKSDVDVGVSCSNATLSTQTVTVAAAAGHESITNTQHAGVDEGGIVKRRGDLLVVLRRGRLFTIGIGGRQLDSLAVADAFGPHARDIEADGTWFDELLVWEHTVVVIGFSRARGGTEIGLFDLADTGDLRHRATYHLRSDDYYSGTNYASRLIGERLVLFTSRRLPADAAPDAWLPAMRRWHEGASSDPFEIIAAISRVFQPVARLGIDPVIHTMISCNLAAPSFACEATVLLGEDLDVYYASPTAAYAWTTKWRRDGDGRSMLYRLPFDGGPVSAIRVSGSPPSQLAFLEDEEDYLNVVVRHPNDVVTLLRLPLSSFSDGSTQARQSDYRSIAHGLGPGLTARFIGAYVLVGGQSWGFDERHPRTVVVSPRGGEARSSLTLAHDAQRIEAMGNDAVVVGMDGGRVSMTAIRLGTRPGIAGSFTQPDAFQSEDRTHGFFYREDSPDTGVFGLPIVTTKSEASEHVPQESARMLFIRNRGLSFAYEGTLDASAKTAVDDHCRSSCVDWYGEARPIFVDDRIFALLGYEIVEGRLAGGRIEEVRRVDFTPR